MPFFIDLPPTNEDFHSTNMEIIQNLSEDNNVPTGLDSQVIRLDKDLINDLYLNDKFNSLLKAWFEETAYTSSLNDIIYNENFQEIVKMGNKAIPLIINEINDSPSELVWALNIITESKLKSKHRLNITEACKKWVNLHYQNKI